MFSRATDLFEGDRKEAVELMIKNAPSHSDKRLIDLLDSDVNTQAVLDLVTRLEYGVYS